MEVAEGDELDERSTLRSIHDMAIVISDQDKDTDILAPLSLTSPTPGRTLLPSPLARAISFATRSTSLALRMGTVVGGYGFDAAKVTTLSSLELGRGILEGILSRAGRDVVARSISDLVKHDAETVLERSLESLHRTMTQIVFWTTTGFHVTGTTFSVVSEVSLLLLSTMDQFFGSTDSSRAIASIITLIRREFENPATGRQGERVGVVDLVLGLSGMAYLQQWCWRLIDDENRRLGIEEVVWDVVVLDDGDRVETHEDSLYGAHSANGYRSVSSTPEQPKPSKIVATSENRGASSLSGDDEIDKDENEGLPEIRLKRQIMRSLPPDAKVSITTEVDTTKTITVDITGSQTAALAPPPGVELIEESRAPLSSSSQRTSNSAYRFVYRVNRHKERSTSFKKEGGVGQMGFVVEQTEEDDTEDGSGVFTELDTRTPSPTPALPPRAPDIKRQLSAATIASHSSKVANSGPACSAQPLKGTRKMPSLPNLSHKTSNSNLANEKRARIPLSSSTWSNVPTAIHHSSSVATAGPTASTTSSSRSGRPLFVPARKPSLTRLLSSRSKEDKQQSRSGYETAKEKPEKTEKRGGLRKALRKGPVPALSRFLQDRDDSGSESSVSMTIRGAKNRKTPASSKNAKAVSQRSKISPTARPSASTIEGSQFVVNRRGPSSLFVSRREAPVAPKRHVGLGLKTTSLDGGPKDGFNEEPFVRASSRASYISVHERRRDSIVSQTDTYSIHAANDFGSSVGGRESGQYLRADMTSFGSPGGKSKTRQDKELTSSSMTLASPLKNHRRVKSSQLYTPSIYTLNTNESLTSLVRYGSYGQQPFQRSAFSDREALANLRRDGVVDGLFPRYHLVRNLRRYMRFASASYGSNFLKIMGLSKRGGGARSVLDETHHELRSFAHHTGSEAGSILLSSFVDAQGGSDGSGSTNTGVPLVHYISLDHESKAVVLACRGTLGFEDVLADMTCEYDDLEWRGQSYKVHKGIHSSARRLLYGADGRVLVTLRQALEEFADYGVVLTGHSLGGAVTALLGVMLAEPAAGGTYFMTKTSGSGGFLLGDGRESMPSCGADGSARHISLPPGRPIHVFAYGPPSTMSESLCRATRGLITSTVNGNDLVPYLSLGVLHDFQAVALAFKTDNNEAKVEVRQRIWEAFQSGVADKWYGYHSSRRRHCNISSRKRHRPNETTNTDGEEDPDDDSDDQWAYAALKVLRSSMMSHKLLPPGEVFVVERSRVLRRDAFTRRQRRQAEDATARGQYATALPAQRVVLKYVRDVEQRFREMRFGTSMLTDHSPGKYESALDKLQSGLGGCSGSGSWGGV